MDRAIRPIGVRKLAIKSWPWLIEIETSNIFSSSVSDVDSSRRPSLSQTTIHRLFALEAARHRRRETCLGLSQNSRRHRGPSSMRCRHILAKPPTCQFLFIFFGTPFHEIFACIEFSIAPQCRKSNRRSHERIQILSTTPIKWGPLGWRYWWTHVSLTWPRHRFICYRHVLS